MSSAKDKILSLATEYAQALHKLLEIAPILRGSFAQIFTRCGKPNCWCAQSKKGHPHTRMTWSQNGQMVTRKVPAEAVEQIQELTRKYRQFRSARRALTALHAKIEARLDSYEERLTTESRRSFPSLGQKSKMLRPSEKTDAKSSEN